MRIRVFELLATATAPAKLGARGISVAEAEQLIYNQHVIKRNAAGRSGEAERVLVIGYTDGGRALTLVVERTLDPTSWLIDTGWVAIRRERDTLE